MTLHDLSEPLHTFAVQLSAHGFALSTDNCSDAFGDRIVVFTRSSLSIRLVRDRSQWFIEVGCEDWEDWFDSDTWKRCLLRTPISDDPPPLPEQAKFIIAHLDQIDGTLDDPGGQLRRCLNETRASRARRRLGLGLEA